MAVVGNAHIIVQAITTGFKKDVEKALKDLNSTMSDSGEEGAKEFNKSFDKEFKEYLKDFDPFEGRDKVFQDGGRDAGKSFSSEFKTNLSMMKTLDLMGGDFEKAGRDAGKRFANGFNNQFKKSLQKQVPQALMPIGRGTAASNAFRRSISSMQQDAIRANEILSRLITTSYFVGPAISVAIGGISSLIGGLVPLISQLAAATPSLMVIPSSIAAIGQAAIVAKIAFGGYKDALKEIAKRRRGSAEVDPLAGLSRDALNFAEAIVTAKEKLNILKKAAGRDLFGPLEDSLNSLMTKLLPKLVPAFQQTGAALGNIASQITKAVTSASNMQKLDRIMSTNAEVLSIFGSTIANLYDSFLSLGDAVRPLLVRFAKWTSTLTDSWKRSLDLKNNTGQLTKTFSKAGDVAAQLGRIFGNLGRAIMSIGRSASGPGSGGELLFNLFEKSTKKFEEFTSSLEKNGKLKEFFYDVAVNFNEISKLIVVIVKEFAKLGDDTGVADTAKALVPMVETLGEMARVLQSAAPSLGEFAKKLIDIMMSFTESGSINTFFSILTSVLDVLNDVFSNEMVINIIKIVAPMLAVIKALRLMKNIAAFFSKAFIGYFVKAENSVGTFNNALQRSKAIALANRGMVTKLGDSIKYVGLSFKYAASDIIASFKNISRQSQMSGTAVNTGFVATFKNLKSNIGASFTGLAASLRQYQDELKKVGSSVGMVAGQAIGMAITSALSGVVLGSAGGDKVQQGVGIAGILMSAIGTGAMIGGPVGVAVGALVGGLGVLTSAFTASGEAAKLAAEKIKGYADAAYDALVQGEFVSDAVAQKITESFKLLDTDVAKTLENFGFNVKEMADAINAGSDAFENYSFDVFSSGLQKLGVDIQKYGIDSFEKLVKEAVKGTFEGGEFADALEAAGISVKDLMLAMKFMYDEGVGALSGLDRAATDAAVATGNLADVGKVVGERLFYASSDANLFAQKLQAINDEAAKQNKLERAIARVSAELGVLNEKADIAKQAVMRLLNPPETFGEIVSQATLDLARFGDELSNVKGPFKEDQINIITGDFRESLAGAISDGFSSGALTGAEDVKKFLKDISGKINLLDISEKDKQLLRSQIENIQNNPELLEKIQQWGVAQGSALGKARAESEMQSYELAMEQWYSSNAGLFNKLLSGEALTNEERLTLQRSPTGTATVYAELRIETGLMKEEVESAISELEKEFEGKFEVQGKIKNATSWVDPASGMRVSTKLKKEMEAVGLQADLGLAAGINNKAPASVAAVVQLSNRVKASAADAFKLGSPSRVFKGFGRNISEGLALGITDGAGLAISAAQGMFDSISGVSQPVLGGSYPGMSLSGVTGLGGGASAGTTNQSNTTQNFNIQVESPRPMRTAKDVVREFQALSYRMGY